LAEPFCIASALCLNWHWTATLFLISQELKEARERAEFFRGQYATKEAERKEMAAQLAEARALNTALESQVGFYSLVLAVLNHSLMAMDSRGPLNCLCFKALCIQRFRCPSGRTPSGLLHCRCSSRHCCHPCRCCCLACCCSCCGHNKAVNHRCLSLPCPSQLLDTTGALKEAIETASALLEQVCMVHCLAMGTA